MSLNRICPICLQIEGIRVNFGNKQKEEQDFHNQKWCSCGYKSHSEMIIDQDLGFNDFRWVGIVKNFLNSYYKYLSQQIISNKDQHARLFLKQLQNSALKQNLSIVLKPLNTNKYIDYKIDGFPKVKPKSNIFDDTFELKHVPKKVVLDTLNENLLKEYKNSQKIINQLRRNDIKKNRVVVLFILILIFETMILVFN